MLFTVIQPTCRRTIGADEHRVEGGWHVFRRTVTVMGQPRTVVALRLPVTEVKSVMPG